MVETYFIRKFISLKGVVFDVRTKKHIRTIRRWSGQVTKDGRLGLYAPSRGGLELVKRITFIFF